MATIYVVTSGEYSAYSIHAVFSTREKAQQFIDEYDWDYRKGEIEEYPLDRWEGIRNRTFWQVWIYETGPDVGTTEVWSYPLTPDTEDDPDKQSVTLESGTALFVEQIDEPVLHTVHHRVPRTWWRVIVEAKDEGAAIKIAAEKAAIAKASAAGMT